MRVSVVIPCYNSGAHLRKTVASALEQTLPPLEILCVDDASTDGTWETILDLARSSGGIVNPMRHAARRGTPAAGRNTAIAAASGDWIAFLDHDDLWIPTKLELQSRRLAEKPEAGVIHAEGWMEVEAEDGLLTRRLMHEKRRVPETDSLRALFHTNFTLNSTAIVRRDWLGRVGPLSEDPALLGVDDYDLWIRLARLGCPFAYVAEPVAVWRRHSSNLSGNEIRRLRGCLTILERILIDEPDLALKLGVTETRARILSLRLEVAAMLLKEGNSGEAESELAKVWSVARGDPKLWRLRLELAVRGGENGQAARRVRRVAHIFRDRSRAALAEMA